MAGLAGMCLALLFYNIMIGFSPSQNQQDVIDTISPDYSIQFRCLDVLLGCSRKLSAGIKPKPQNLLVLCLVALAGDVEINPGPFDVDTDNSCNIFPFHGEHGELEMDKDCWGLDMESLPLPTTQQGPKLSGLRMAHLNICSLANKTDQLMDIIAKDKYDVVAITETHLSHEIGDPWLKLRVSPCSGKIETEKVGVL